MSVSPAVESIPMKGDLLCLPCTVRTAYSLATRATDNEELQKQVIMQTIKWLAEHPEITKLDPTTFHTHVFRIVQKVTGNADPFKQLKKASSEVALATVPILEKEAEKNDFKETFKTAIMGAICGNTIDFEVEGHAVSIENLQCSLENCLKERLHIDDTEKLMKALSKSRRVLYLLDNAGEIVFDKFLIRKITEKYAAKVIAAVKERPVLNDATMENAEQIKLAEVAEIITTGSDHIGLNMEEASEEFKKHLFGSDLIIAKGQGYYESMSEVESLLPKPIVYILCAKCAIIAKSLGVPQHGNIVRVVI